MASSDEAHDAAIDVTAITHSQESSQQILGTSAPKYGNILQVNASVLDCSILCILLYFSTLSYGYADV